MIATVCTSRFVVQPLEAVHRLEAVVRVRLEHVLADLRIAQPEYHDSGMATRSSSTRSWAIAAVCGEPVDWLKIATSSRSASYFSCVHGDVVAVVLDDQLDLTAGDAALGVDLVPEHLLGLDDLGDERGEGARQVGEHADLDRRVVDADVGGDARRVDLLAGGRLRRLRCRRWSPRSRPSRPPWSCAGVGRRVRGRRRRRRAGVRRCLGGRGVGAASSSSSSPPQPRRRGRAAASTAIHRHFLVISSPCGWCWLSLRRCVGRAVSR